MTFQCHIVFYSFLFFWYKKINLSICRIYKNGDEVSKIKGRRKKREWIKRKREEENDDEKKRLIKLHVNVAYSV